MTIPEKIANTFNNYFANIGTNLASTISNDQTETCTQYLQTPSAISCIFRHITEEETIKLSTEWRINQVQDMTVYQIKY